MAGNADSGAHRGKGQPSTSNAGHSTREHRLADQFSELARSLWQQDDVEDTLNAIVQVAVETVPGGQHASISAIEGRREVHTRAFTDDLSVAVDRAQYETGEGPCLDTLYREQTVRLSDLAAERRWPQFTARAIELEVGSMLCVQLYVEGNDLGALNLTSTKPEAFSDESEHIALLFAAHAAVAMARAEQQEQMRQGMDTRTLIGQAQGILMAQSRLTAADAFGLLVRASQRSNTKLRDVAARIVSDTEQGADRVRPGPPSGPPRPAG